MTWAPSGGCCGCPNRGTCHESRQRVQDPIVDIGRHYACEFHGRIEEARAERAQPGWMERIRRRIVAGG